MLAWIVVAALIGAVVLKRQDSTRVTTASDRRPDLSVKWHVGPTLSQLRANFAELRRPATAAEHAAAVSTFPTVTSAQTAPAEYVRLLGHVEGQAAYLVINPIFRRGARGAVVAHLMTIDGGNDPVGGGLGGYSYAPGNYAIFPETDAAPGHAVAFVGVVPDGVRSVRWDFACIDGTHTSLHGCQLPSPRIANVPVHDNLAALVTDYGYISGGSSYAGVTRVTWYGPAGMTKVFTNPLTAVPFPGAPARRP